MSLGARVRGFWVWRQWCFWYWTAEVILWTTIRLLRVAPRGRPAKIITSIHFWVFHGCRERALAYEEVLHGRRVA